MLFCILLLEFKVMKMEFIHIAKNYFYTLLFFFFSLLLKVLKMSPLLTSSTQHLPFPVYCLCLYIHNITFNGVRFH